MKEIVGPVAQTSMMIKKPVNELFSAFVEPEKLKQFWLNNSSGKLSDGAKVEWEFMVEGAKSKIEVKKFEENKVIDLRWEDGSTSELRFKKVDENNSVIDVRTYGFSGTEDEKLMSVIDNTSGFTFVICDLKTYLEQGKSMNICRDKAELITKKL